MVSSKVLPLSQGLSAIQIKRRKVYPALFNDRLSRYYLIHKLNCCLACLSIVSSGLSCCGNKRTLNGRLCEGLVPVLVTHHSSHTIRCQGAERGKDAL